MRKIYDVLKEFSSNTSAHGIRSIFHEKHLIVKLVFLACWFCAFGFCVGRTITCVRKYRSSQTTTRYEMYPSSGSAVMQFPTVTICNKNRVRRQFLEENPVLSELWGMLENFDFAALSKVDWDGKFSPFRNITYQHVLRHGEMDNKTLFSCTQANARYCRSTAMGEDYFTRDVDMISGSCFRINPLGNLRGKSGEFGLLKIIMLADVESYSIPPGSFVQPGWIMALHDSRRFATAIESGTNIAPGFLYNIDINLMRVENYAGHCAHGRVNTTYGSYDRTSCLLDCRDVSLNKTCGCLIVLPPWNTLNYTECTLEETANCALMAYYEYVVTFTDVEAKQLDCDCSAVACTYVSYKNTVSSIPIDKAYVETAIKRWQRRLGPYDWYNATDLLRNVAILQIVFGSSHITDVQEDLAYDFDNLLGDIGGVMGLFLGASLFTIMEFISLIVTVSRKLLKKLFSANEKEIRPSIHRSEYCL